MEKLLTEMLRSTRVSRILTKTMQSFFKFTTKSVNNAYLANISNAKNATGSKISKTVPMGRRI